MGRARALRTWGGAAVTVLVTGALALLIGVPAAQVEGSLGPHRATYAVSVRDAIQVDLGPLGSLVLDSPLPWPLGVEVRVQEIPAGLSDLGEDPTQALAADLDGYLQFFAQPDIAVREAAADLADDALRRVVLVWSVLILLAAAVRLASRRGALRVELRAVLARPGVAALVAAVAAGSVVIPLRDWAAGPPLGGPGRPSPVLAGTVLEEARIVGRLRDLVDTYGGYALRAIDENRDFYDRATVNLVAAYAADPEPTAPAVPPVAKTLAPPDPAEDRAEVPGEEGAGAPGGEGAEVPGGDGAEVAGGDGAEVPGGDVVGDPDTGEVRPGVEPLAPLGDPDGFVTFLLVADLHCNVGMAQVVGEAVRLSGADAVLNAGDTVISGTTVEQFCVDALAQAVPDRVPIVVADGNHDTEETTRQERAAGNIVLSGEPVVVRGVRIIGDAEPNITVVTTGRRLRGSETRGEMGLRLGERACELKEAGTPVDIMLVHNPRGGVAPMASGCLTLQLSGHLHRQVGPTHQGLGILYALGTTAGATHGQTSIGPLRSPGVMSVMRFDPESRRPVDHRVIEVGTDTSVRLGRWLPFPAPPVVPVQADLDATYPGDTYDAHS